MGQLFFMKKKEATQHPPRNTLSTTSSFIPSSCLPLCTFPAARQTKGRIWTWNGLNITVEMGGGVRIPSPDLLQDWWRPSAACFSPAPQQSPTETRGTGMQCESLLMTGLMLKLSCVRSPDGKGYWPSLFNFIHFQQGSFQSPSSLVESTYWNQSSPLLAWWAEVTKAVTIHLVPGLWHAMSQTKSSMFTVAPVPHLHWPDFAS